MISKMDLLVKHDKRIKMGTLNVKVVGSSGNGVKAKIGGLGYTPVHKSPLLKYGDNIPIKTESKK